MTSGGLAPVLLIGEVDDADIAALEAALTGRGVSTLFFPLGLEASAYEIEWWSNGRPVLSYDGLELSNEVVEAASAVMFKLSRMDERPLVRYISEETGESAFGEREWNAALLNAIQELIDASAGITVGSPRDADWHHWKLSMLAAARRANLRVPPWVVATGPLTRPLTWDRVVAKAINADESISPGFVFPTTEVSSDIVVSHLSTRRDVPSLLQTKVERRHEIRSILVGQDVIDASLTVDADQTDLRFSNNVQVDAISVTPVRLHRLSPLIQEFRLTYCCFDSILNCNGEAELIDITPRGSWSWLDRKSTPSVSDSICDVLLRGSPRR